MTHLTQHPAECLQPVGVKVRGGSGERLAGWVASAPGTHITGHVGETVLGESSPVPRSPALLIRSGRVRLATVHSMACVSKREGQLISLVQEVARWTLQSSECSCYQYVLSSLALTWTCCASSVLSYQRWRRNDLPKPSRLASSHWPPGGVFWLELLFCRCSTPLSYGSQGVN